MANKKMKVVVRRKGEESPTEKSAGGCFLPAFVPSSSSKKNNNKRSPGRKRGAAAAGAMTTSSASSDPQQLASNDGQAWEATHAPLFPSHPKGKPTTDHPTVNNNISVGGESNGSTQPLSWGSRTSSGMSTRTPPSPDHRVVVEQLLTLPAPQDRSDRRRLKYEREKRQQGTYEGELEPAGTRGQEASVNNTRRNQRAAAEAGIPQMRSFQDQPPSVERKNFAGKQVTLVLPALKEDLAPVPEAAPSRIPTTTTAPEFTPEPLFSTTSSISTKPSPFTTPTRQPPRVTTVADDASDGSSSSQFSNNSQAMRKEYLPPVQLHTGTGLAMRGPIVLETSNPRSSSSIPSAYYTRPDDEKDYDDDESTQSDEELRQMQADLMPSFSADNEMNKQHDQVPSRLQPSAQGPSPAAAAAAAAAAATLQQKRPPQPKPPTPPKQQLRQPEIDRYNAQAMDAVQEGRLNDAVELFIKVLLLQKPENGDKHPGVASAYHNLGTVQAKRAAALTEDAVAQQLCRTAALEAFQAAARTARDCLGPTHPNVAVSLVRIGFLLLHSKQYSNALVTFAEALRIRTQAFGQNHALTANLYNNLGVCHMHIGEFEQGRRALHTGLGIQRKLCAESDARAKTNGTVPWLELADTLFNIGGLCLEWIRKQGPDLRRAEESEDAFSEAYDVSQVYECVGTSRFSKA